MGKTRKVRKVKGGGKSRPLTSKSKLNSKLFKKPLPVKKENVFSMSNLFGALENKSNAPAPTPKKTLVNIKSTLFEENPLTTLQEVGEKLQKLNKQKSIKIAGPYSLVMHMYEPDLREFLDESTVNEVLQSVDEAVENPKDFLNNISRMFESLADTYDATEDEEDRNRIAELSYHLLIDLFTIVSPDAPKTLTKTQSTANAFKMKSLMNALNAL